LVINEEACEFGDDPMIDLMMIVYADDGKVQWNSCFGAAFHMTRRDHVIYERMRLLLRRKLLRRH